MVGCGFFIVLQCYYFLSRLYFQYLSNFLPQKIFLSCFYSTFESGFSPVLTHSLDF